MGAERLAPALVGALLLILPILGCDVDRSTAAPAANRLGEMIQAEKSISWEGVKEVTTRSRGHLVTRWYFVSHRPGKPMRLERIGPVSRRHSRSFRGSRLYWFGDRELLLRNYHVEEGGTERVADRDGIVLNVRSFHPGRPRMRLVVDEEVGLLLAIERRDHRGELCYRSRFQTILMEPAAAETGREEGRTRSPSEHMKEGKGATSRRELGFTLLEPQHLPLGFERKMRVPRRWRGGGSRALYSDGLSWIELSQSKADENTEEQVVRKWQRGDRVVMKMAYRGVSVRLVGRLPAEELLEMLRSLAPLAVEE